MKKVAVIISVSFKTVHIILMPNLNVHCVITEFMARIVTQVEMWQNLQGFFCQHVIDNLCPCLHQINQTAVFTVLGNQEHEQYIYNDTLIM